MALMVLIVGMCGGCIWGLTLQDRKFKYQVQEYKKERERATTMRIIAKHDAELERYDWKKAQGVAASSAQPE